MKLRISETRQAIYFLILSKAEIQSLTLLIFMIHFLLMIQMETINTYKLASITKYRKFALKNHGMLI